MTYILQSMKDLSDQIVEYNLHALHTSVVSPSRVWVRICATHRIREYHLENKACYFSWQACIWESGDSGVKNSHAKVNETSAACRLSKTMSLWHVKTLHFNSNFGVFHVFLLSNNFRDYDKDTVLKYIKFFRTLFKYPKLHSGKV